MQLYAKIKKSSKYYSQNDMAKLNGYGLPFKVEIDPDSVRGEKTDHDDYCIKGGPGAQYRLTDVNLFVKRSDGVPVRIR